MRQVISLSLPAPQAAGIKKLAAKRGFGSVSTYITSLIQSDVDLITEEALLRSVKKARAEYQQGKVIHAKSLDDLL